MEIDGVDRKLLNALQDNCQRSVAELAAEAGTSAPTCHRRLRRLRECGIIQREAAILDLEQTPRPVSILIDIALEKHDRKTHAAFEEKMLRTPEVSQCYNTSGQTDYVVVMNVADIAEYHSLATRIFSADPSVRTFRSTIAIKRVKFDTAIRL
jgi:Lrp/AsnC family leucine-responsive transcriptional regulator